MESLGVEPTKLHLFNSAPKPIKCWEKLMANKYPTIWHLNDEDQKTLMMKKKGLKVDGKEKFIGSFSNRYISKIKNTEDKE